MEPSPDKEAVTKKMRALARLRRCHTTVEPAKQGRLLKVRTYCPSEPPPGQTLPDRQVQTDLTTIATPEGAHYLVEHTIRMPTLEHFQYFWDRPQFRMLGLLPDQSKPRLLPDHRHPAPQSLLLLLLSFRSQTVSKMLLQLLAAIT